MPYFEPLDAAFIERRSSKTGDTDWYEVDGKRYGIARWRNMPDRPVLVGQDGVRIADVVVLNGACSSAAAS